jgi:hypothetical protein
LLSLTTFFIAHYTRARFPADTVLQSVCQLVVVRSRMADFRDRLERDRLFTSVELNQLAGLERAYVREIAAFYDNLPRSKQKLYGAAAGTPKTINSLQYSRVFERFGCISVFDTGEFKHCLNVF